jgi:cellulose synthase/poly-beta-1,6-N-acetylglucosamine synthase-like glycosyltransferase
LPEPYWVARTAAAFETQQYVMLLGPVKIAPASSILQQWQALEFMSLIATTAGAAGIGFPSMANGANMAFSRNELIEAGGFVQQPDIASGDDIFLLLKLLQKHGAKKIQFLLAEDSIVYTKASPNWHSFLKQRMRWVSKSKAYRHPNILVPAIVVLVFNILLLFLLAASLLYPYLLLVFALFVVLKYLIDLPILQAVAGFMKSRNLLRWAFPMQLVYPFYVLIASVAGLLFKSSWKGRK